MRTADMAIGERLLLCVGAARATLGRWHRGRLVETRTFSAEAEGIAGFVAALASARRVPIHALVDAVEEDYRTELLPHTRGRERANLVQRRLRQLYRNSPFNAAALQGRETEGRRDDRYLFAALTNSEVFLPWAEAIEEAKQPFAGLYLLPMVMPFLADRLGAAGAPTLVIAATAGGLRQTFIDHGQLRVSRLTPLAGSGERNPVATLVEEIGNTRLYLEALKLCGRDDPLSVTLVDSDGSLAGAVAALEAQGSSISCMRFGAQALAAKLPLSEQTLRETPDALALTLLGLHAPTLNLAPAPSLRRFEILTTQRALHAAAAAVAAVGLVFAVTNIWQYRQLAAQVAEQRRETLQWQQRYVAVTRQFPESPAPLQTLQQTVEAARLIARQTRTPERAYAVVAGVLDAQPEISLRRLIWRHGVPLGESDAGPGGGPRPATAGGERVESIAIEAEIAAAGGELRSAIASIESVARRLRDDPRVLSAVIAQLPLNLSPGSSIAGSTQERAQSGSASTFRVVVVLRPDGAAGVPGRSQAPVPQRTAQGVR